jgi:hypothetical protein
MNIIPKYRYMKGLIDFERAGARVIQKKSATGAMLRELAAGLIE